MKRALTKIMDKPPKEPTYIKPINVNVLLEITLEERMKQLIIFAEHPDEVDAIAEAYRKIVGIRSRKKEGK